MDDFGDPIWRYHTWNFGDTGRNPAYKGWPFSEGFNYTGMCYHRIPWAIANDLRWV